MNFKVIKQLYKKEILDVLRDKKTIIMMVIVPLLIYPLMFVGGMVMMSKVTTQMDTQTYEIAVDFMDTNPELVEMFLHPDDDTLHFKLCHLKKKIGLLKNSGCRYFDDPAGRKDQCDRI